ncbi:hypothetical protein CAEBREN_12692 [Caenorhabditis brenneri]|uniref:Uncharacterized protein n=1 Tax=Caenorhabditis brenneri TaxID=135651 RepID=G0P1K9_CAEBE|nr:hypothetical protein CAEBREN_12692 [Caenorhabditis brenneri]
MSTGILSKQQVWINDMYNNPQRRMLTPQNQTTSRCFSTCNRFGAFEDFETKDETRIIYNEKDTIRPAFNEAVGIQALHGYDLKPSRLMRRMFNTGILEGMRPATSLVFVL